MRILVVHPGPNFSVADVHAGWVEALRGLGCQVASYNLDDRIQFYSHALLDTEEKDEDGHPLVRKAMTNEDAFRAAMQGLSHALYTMWPDVVLFVSGFFVNPGTLQLIQSRRHRIVLLHTESPYQEDTQLERAQFADVNLLNDPVNIERYQQLDGDVAYAPHSYRPHVHYPRPAGVPLNPELNADLAFIGTGFTSRVEFFGEMNLDGLDLLLGGNWAELDPDSPLRKYLAHSDTQCVDNAEAAEVYRHAKCGINFYRREWEEGMTPGPTWAMGPREVEMAACGLPFIRDPRGEGDEVLPMLPVFSSPAEASELVRWLAVHEELRAGMAAKARAAIADRTFENNARRLLELLG
jgi:hypothetical protein